MDFKYKIKRSLYQGVCGIYLLENTQNGKRYVGSSKNIYHRLAKHKHLLARSLHDNEHLQNSCNLYGMNVFMASILEECKESELQDAENKWIANYDCMNKEKGYNKCEVSKCRANHVSDETKSKISRTLMKNGIIVMADKKSGERLKEFESLFNAAEYIIKEGLTTSKSSHVRMRISQAANNKQISTGHGRKAHRLSVYGYKWEVCYRMRMRKKECYAS